MTNTTPYIIEKLRAIVGSQGLHSSLLGDQTNSWEEDWRHRLKGAERGRALAVVLPKNLQQVAEVVKACVAANVPMVPQGGNTGLVLGATPTAAGCEVVINLSKMNRIRDLNNINNTITVEAGCPLQQVQEAADVAEKLFPLSMASEGSCTIGGNLATNAGGTAVLSFGNMRDLCLGLEIVTASGEICSGLQGLRKDNTGYDLRHLFIGAEGTLGIITAATLKLFPKPKATHSAWLTLSSLSEVMALFEMARSYFANNLVGFEVMNAESLLLVQNHFASLKMPLATEPWQVLIETHNHQSNTHGYDRLESLLELLFEEKVINNGVLPQSDSQMKNLWLVRESIPLAQAQEGINIKHDIALPISNITNFVAEAEKELECYLPGVRVVNFGHIGDGNLHFNIQAPTNTNADVFLKAHEANINTLVYDLVQKFNGSISAEHGIGRLKTDWLIRTKSPTAIDIMQKIKAALDPHNLMNPGRILQDTLSTVTTQSSIADTIRKL